MGARLSDVASLVRRAFERERLPPPPAETAVAGARRRPLLSVLFAPEPLPGPPPASTAPAPGRPGLLRSLFALERLPPPPPPGPPAPPRRRLVSLFLPESLDPP